MERLPDTHSAMKLAAALRRAGLEDMAARAETGHYHDYLSPLDFPDLALLEELHQAAAQGNVAARALVARHMNGDFDATKEESDTWARSPDGRAAFAALLDKAEDEEGEG